MLTFHRQEDHALRELIEDKIKDLVVAHRLEPLHSREEEPYLSWSGQIVKGKDAMLFYLDNLGKELEVQRSISADACYIDPETGEVC